VVEFRHGGSVLLVVVVNAAGTHASKPAYFNHTSLMVGQATPRPQSSPWLSYRSPIRIVVRGRS
jgi:LPS sulfotransferase NodH